MSAAKSWPLIRRHSQPGSQPTPRSIPSRQFRVHPLWHLQGPFTSSKAPSAEPVSCANQAAAWLQLFLGSPSLRGGSCSRDADDEALRALRSSARRLECLVALGLRDLTADRLRKRFAVLGESLRATPGSDQIDDPFAELRRVRVPMSLRHGEHLPSLLGRCPSNRGYFTSSAGSPRGHHGSVRCARAGSSTKDRGARNGSQPRASCTTSPRRRWPTNSFTASGTSS